MALTMLYQNDEYSYFKSSKFKFTDTVRVEHADSWAVGGGFYHVRVWRNAGGWVHVLSMSVKTAKGNPEVAAQQAIEVIHG